jgi:hypothetical protein
MLQPNPADRPESTAAVAAWRPISEMRPPPRCAAATRDRTEDMFQTPRARRSQNPLGRRLATGAFSVVLFLGLGSLYFSIWPPKPPPTDPDEFLNAYDGGNCFFLTREALSGDPKIRDVDALGSLGAPFELSAPNSDAKAVPRGEFSLSHQEPTRGGTPARHCHGRTDTGLSGNVGLRRRVGRPTRRAFADHRGWIRAQRYRRSQAD